MSAVPSADKWGMPKFTAPEWGDTIPQHIVWSCWFLEGNPHVYQAFAARADDLRAGNPSRRISSEQVINYLRWHTSVTAEGDKFGLCSNAKSLFGRLYKRANPNAVLDNRRSWLDALTPQEYEPIIEAWNPSNGTGA